jgi:hypothetical protein
MVTSSKERWRVPEGALIMAELRPTNIWAAR